MSKVESSVVPWLVLGGTVGVMGGLILHSYTREPDLSIDDPAYKEPVWGLTRRFTARQVLELERLWVDGMRKPSLKDSDEIINRIGRDGEHGLLISRNMVRLWFEERALRGEHLHTCEDDGLKDCECWHNSNSRPPPAYGGDGPDKVTIKPNEEVWVCMCGQSKNFPFCDGSHKEYNEKSGTKIVPRRVNNESDEDRDVYLCACGHSKKRPFCDGTHKKAKMTEQR